WKSYMEAYSRLDGDEIAARFRGSLEAAERDGLNYEVFNQAGRARYVADRMRQDMRGERDGFFKALVEANHAAQALANDIAQVTDPGKKARWEEAIAAWNRHAGAQLAYLADEAATAKDMSREADPSDVAGYQKVIDLHEQMRVELDSALPREAPPPA